MRIRSSSELTWPDPDEDTVIPSVFIGEDKSVPFLTAYDRKRLLLPFPVTDNFDVNPETVVMFCDYVQMIGVSIRETVTEILAEGRAPSPIIGAYFILTNPETGLRYLAPTVLNIPIEAFDDPAEIRHMTQIEMPLQLAKFMVANNAEPFCYFFYGGVVAQYFPSLPGETPDQTRNRVHDENLQGSPADMVECVVYVLENPVSSWYFTEKVDSVTPGQMGVTGAPRHLVEVLRNDVQPIKSDMALNAPSPPWQDVLARAIYLADAMRNKGLSPDADVSELIDWLRNRTHV